VIKKIIVTKILRRDKNDHDHARRTVDYSTVCSVTGRAAVGMGIPMGIPMGMGMVWVWGL